MRIFSAVLFALAAAYSAYELYRWRLPANREDLARPQKVRRIAGMVLLLSVCALCNHGTYLPSGHLSKHAAARQLVYWLFTLLLAAIIPLVAIREFRATLEQRNLRGLARERKDAYDSMLQSVVEAQNREAQRHAPGRNGSGH